MIKLTKDLFLKEIVSSDISTLFKLMQEIYPPAYSHFWQDSGTWYVNTQYAKKNVLKELSEEKSDYYFVIYKDEIIGNFRIIWDEKLEGLKVEKQVKLHRLYLHQKTQGKGIGKKLVNFLEESVKQKKYKIVWLDTMNEQPQAFQFYKKLGYKYHSNRLLPFKLMFDKFRKMIQVYKEI